MNSCARLARTGVKRTKTAGRRAEETVAEAGRAAGPEKNRAKKRKEEAE